MNNDLISRSALKEALDRVQYTQEFCIEHQIDYSISMQMLGMIIDNAPTVEERPQGDWNYIQAGMAVCPFCGATPHKQYKNFCPQCGAKMEN